MRSRRMNHTAETNYSGQPKYVLGLVHETFDVWIEFGCSFIRQTFHVPNSISAKRKPLNFPVVHLIN